MRNRKWIGLLTAVVVAAACLGLTACGDTAVTGVKLDKTTASVEVGKTVTLKATVEPEDASDKNVTWTTDKAAVATVKDGVVTGVAAGTAKITAACGEKSASCTVTVTAPAPEAIFAEDFADGNNDVFGVYGTVTKGNGTVILNKAADQETGPSTYFGKATDKNTPWTDKGLVVSMKIKIDGAALETGEGFNWTVSLNNTASPKSYLTERSLYFRKYAEGVRVGYVDNGSSDGINASATAESNDKSAALADGWYTAEFKYYVKNNNVALTVTVKNAEGTSVFTAEGNVTDNTNAAIATSKVGGLRYGWMSLMNADSVEVDDLTVTEVK